MASTIFSLIIYATF